jgi:hypothetical protein
MALVDQDQDHLRLLTIAHYAYAGILALFACFPIIHLTIGLALLTHPGAIGAGKTPAPAFVGLLFAIIGGLFVLIGWTLAICTFFAGRFLARRKHYVFCLIVAGANCTTMPFGTALGVFTIIVLLRPSVKALFTVPQPPPVPSAYPDPR